MKQRYIKNPLSAFFRILVICLILAVSVNGYAMSYRTDGIKVTGTGTSAQVSAELTSIEGYEEIMLIALSQNKSDAKIKDIFVDRKAVGSSESVFLSATVQVAADEELKYYLLDGNGSSLTNAAPKSASSLETNVTVDTVTISWEHAADDNGNTEYIIYKDGTECGRTSESTYTVEGLEQGIRYTFGVESVDKMGVKGPVAEIADEPSLGMTFEKAASKAAYSALFTKEGIVGDIINTNVAGGYFDTRYFAWEPAQWDNKYNFKSDLVSENISGDYTMYVMAGSYAVGDTSKNGGNGALHVSDGQDNSVATINISPNTIVLDDHKNDCIETGYTMYKVQSADWHMTKDSVVKFNSSTKNGTLIRKIYIFETSKITDEIEAAMMGKTFVPDSAVQIFIASDSIAAEYTSGAVTGWGMEFSKYVAEGAELVNLAYPGSSTVTFPNKEALFERAGQGDYVIICFGHNDSMGDTRGVPLDQYKENLKEYIDNTVSKGAIPIILTSIPQYNTDGYMVYNRGEALMSYREAALEVAEQNNVAFFDSAKAMNKAFLAEYAKDAAAAAEKFLSMYADEGWSNRTHLTKPGAELLAKLIAKALYNHEALTELKNSMVYDAYFDEPDDSSQPEEPAEPDVPVDPDEEMTFEKAAALASYSAVFTQSGIDGDIVNTNVAGGYFDTQYFAWEPAQWDNKYNFKSSKVTGDISGDYTMYIMAGSYAVGDTSKNDGNGALNIYDGQENLIGNLSIAPNTIVLADHQSSLIEDGYTMYKVQAENWQMTRNSVVKFNSSTKHGTLIRRIYMFKTADVTEAVDMAMMSVN